MLNKTQTVNVGDDGALMVVSSFCREQVNFRCAVGIMDYDAERNEKGEEAKAGQCFYTLCEKTTCCSCFPFGRFKDRKHALYCNLFTAMIACLFIAVIGPLVRVVNLHRQNNT
jgi:hypothetical protein